MVWYGMVWYGMVWYGMVWYGMVWYGMWSSHNSKRNAMTFNGQLLCKGLGESTGYIIMILFFSGFACNNNNNNNNTHLYQCYFAPFPKAQWHFTIIRGCL